jgi:hypothetical protein
MNYVTTKSCWLRSKRKPDFPCYLRCISKLVHFVTFLARQPFQYRPLRVSGKLAVSQTYLTDTIYSVAVSVKAESGLEKSMAMMLTRGTMTASRSSRTQHRP